MNVFALAFLLCATLAARTVAEVPDQVPSGPQHVAFAIKRGVNISHWLSQSARRGSERAAYFTREDVVRIAALGFDHIRLPADEEQLFGENGEKNEEAFALLHQALRWCADAGLRTVVDLHILRSHHFNLANKPLFTDPQAQERFYACWRALSDELKGYPVSMVAYELMNEPVADDPEIWNVIVNRCAQIVRQREPGRKIIIGSNRWQSFATVKALRVPENDPDIIISFHYYEPFLLTHYRAAWTENKKYTGPVHYPGKVIADEDLAGLTPAEKEKFGEANGLVYDIGKIEKDFLEAVSVARAKGLQIYCGEYGCINAAPMGDALRWFRDVNTLFDRLGIARTVWDYKGDFGIVKKGELCQPMVAILTGRETKTAP